ncbi:NAD(P)-binding protein [Polychaeton citri CBS 116435]|uniref:NAD(P)-binding protein n=1 Tax=Polychaeton citri CBS 116435 TaxID=1314669 RepID=A0A9P4Q0B8_9PEZI|nr:NAD(P)-binding protein [Polychaeton citri CBS 116435]
MPGLQAKTILITAASGHIGTELVSLLHESAPKLNLILPTTNASRLKSSFSDSLASDSHIKVVEGNLQDPNWFQDVLVMNKVDTVFFCLTGSEELFTTMNCIDSMIRSKTVKRLIYLSACGDFTSPQALSALMQKCTAAHVLVKSTIEYKLQQGNLPFQWTILGPTLFFINDLRSKQSMLEHGLFDEPLGENGVSRVAPADIALAVRNLALAESDHWHGKKVMVGSKKAFTGAEISDVWSKALGRKIEIFGTSEQDMDNFEASFSAHANSAWGRDLRLMYESFKQMEFGMTDEEYDLQVELLGKEAEDYAAWVNKTAQSWRK